MVDAVVRVSPWPTEVLNYIMSNNKQLTVLHIFSGDLWAGAEVMVYNLLSELKKEPGLKIIALSLNEGTLLDKLQTAKIETYIIPETSNSFISLCWKARKLFKDKKIDIIHSHRYKENLLAVFLSKSVRNIKLITTIHGLPEMALTGVNQGSLTVLKNKFNYFILKTIFDKIVSVSHEMKHGLVQRYRLNPEKIEVIHNGIPLPAINDQGMNKSSNGPLHIGTVGRMVPVKDFDLFLEVAAEIKKRKEKVRFSILGDGPLKKHLVQKAKDLKIEDSVDFVAPMTDPAPYYNSLDIYMNTSIHEGIPLTILEAMSFIKPVIAPNVGGIPEIIDDGKSGVLVKNRSPQEFMHKSLSLINDEDTRTSISRMGRNKVEEEFSLSLMASSYSKMYHDVIIATH